MILEERNFVAVLENIMAELKWKRRLLDAGATEPKAQVRVPKNPKFLAPETVEVQLRWHRPIVDGNTQRCGANMPMLTDVEIQLLNREDLKAKMEDWFVEVLERV